MNKIDWENSLDILTSNTKGENTEQNKHNCDLQIEEIYWISSNLYHSSEAK